MSDSAAVILLIPFIFIRFYVKFIAAWEDEVVNKPELKGRFIGKERCIYSTALVLIVI